MTKYYDNNLYTLSFEEGFLMHDYDIEIYRKNFLFEHKVKSVILNEMNFNKIIHITQKDNFLKIKFTDNEANIKDTLLNLR
jgi:hypothetical protein